MGAGQEGQAGARHSRDAHGAGPWVGAGDGLGERPGPQEAGGVQGMKEAVGGLRWAWEEDRVWIWGSPPTRQPGEGAAEEGRKWEREGGGMEWRREGRKE